jgi:very-short-patch-repair endonuclease
MPKPSGFTFKLMKLLKKLKVNFIPEFNDGYKHVDIRIPTAKLDIEVDGEQHLINPSQIVRDLKRSHYSSKDGFDTIHIHNKDLEGESANNIASALAEAVAIRSEQSRS